jgi:hypothetical protein
MSRSINSPSRCELTSAPSHKRVTRADRHGQPKHTPLCLDADLIALHLPEILRLCDEVFVDGLAMRAAPREPVAHGTLIELKGGRS